jgi:hypothetical protein
MISMMYYFVIHGKNLKRNASKGNWKAFHSPNTISFEPLVDTITIDVPVPKSPLVFLYHC